MNFLILIFFILFNFITAQNDENSTRKHQIGDDSDLASLMIDEVVPYQLKQKEEDSTLVESAGNRLHHVSFPKIEPISTSSHHSHSSAPLTYLNETLILETHNPTPLSYFEFDTKRDQRGLIIAHAGLSLLAFFILYPLAAVLKRGASRFHLILSVAFLFFTILGTLLGLIYRHTTPTLYSGNIHTSTFTWSVIILAVTSTSIELSKFMLDFWKKKKSERNKLKLDIETSMEEEEEAEHTRLVDSPSVNDDDESEFKSVRWDDLPPSSSTSRNSQPRNYSIESDATLYDSTRTNLKSLIHQVVNSRFSILLPWIQILIAWGISLTGMFVYTGTCRGNYLNGCLAHAIKGSVFIFYGIFTFTRYLGAFSTIGWAWNRRSVQFVSAEFIESFVCFLYGSTQSFMERFGKNDSAYTMKDYEHISIDLIFWVGGSLGMMLESSTIRNWISNPTRLLLPPSSSSQPMIEPAIHQFSFNPFPALIIGLVGYSMSTHHQMYQFQIDLHSLWGNLLILFSIFRILSYCFLYLRPPTSFLPTRPPTEAIASLFLTCSGVASVLSMEEITFFAMRNGLDDKGVVLNLTVVIVLIWFSWILILFGFNGWAWRN